MALSSACHSAGARGLSEGSASSQEVSRSLIRTLAPPRSPLSTSAAESTTITRKEERSPSLDGDAAFANVTRGTGSGSTLTASEEAHLRALETAPLTTLDVMPTLLDLAGILDAKSIAPLRAQMPGTSLLRGGSTADRGIVMTNCSELWQCAFKNWGAVKGTRKAIAHQYDHDWSCFDVKDDPKELHDLGSAACGDLVTLAEGAGRGRPF